MVNSLEITLAGVNDELHTEWLIKSFQKDIEIASISEINQPLDSKSLKEFWAENINSCRFVYGDIVIWTPYLQVLRALIVESVIKSNPIGFDEALLLSDNAYITALNEIQHINIETNKVNIQLGENPIRTRKDKSLSFENILETLKASFKFDHSLKYDSVSELEIQIQIRTILNNYDSRFKIPFEHVNSIVIVGGNKNSNSSEIADYFQSQHSYIRLNADYFCDNRAVSFNKIDKQCRNFVYNLEEFIQFNPFSRAYVIEATLDSNTFASLKSLLGEIVILLDDKDLNQNVESRWSKADRLAVKYSENSEMKKIISAPAIINSQANEITEKILDYFTEEKEAINLIAIGGSAGLGNYRANWSDIDVLMVIKDENFISIVSKLPVVLSELRNTSISVFTQNEIYRMAVPPKIAFMIKLLSENYLSPFFQSKEFKLPRVDLARERQWAMAELIIVIDRLRRYLQDRPIRKRAVYKYCTLICRLMLRIYGDEKIDESDVLTAFRINFKCNAVITLEKMGPAIEEEHLVKEALNLSDWLANFQ
ncbi:nucleotidyltransferase domain-containing protein [Cohnella sp. GCM10020058]|uniref:nucleotidyltransferase domain-containing protein n=1 Tax=Cohnella sp. GCM10020058 TaxID=3317330 RepID=UPI00363F0148